MDDIKVSVIIPVYNTKPFLRKCLDSICTQTLKEIEIICVDDGSSDGSGMILEEYAQKDHRVSVIHLEHTGNGAADARNAGLEIARGKYLSFLDSDDYFDRAMLEKIYTKAIGFNTDIVMYDAQRFDSVTGNYVPTSDILRFDYLPEKEVFSSFDFPDYVFLSTIGAAWCMLFRRGFVLDHELHFQSVYHADDLFFTYCSLAVAKSITFIPEKLLFYRINNSGSQSSNKEIDPNASVLACLYLKKWLESKGVYSVLRRGYLNILVKYCRWYLDTMPTYSHFNCLYHSLKENYYSELGLEDVSADDFILPGAYEWCEKIRLLTAGEYIYAKLPIFNQETFYYTSNYVFPKQCVDENERIILYGAGNIGKAYYIQNIVEGFCDIAGWVDINASKMPNPIEDIQILSEKEFDKVIIAIESKNAIQQVKSNLLKLGIAEEQIIHM